MKILPERGIPHSDAVSIISAGVEVKGDIKTRGSIRIDGKVQGNVTAEGNVTLGEFSEIHGEVKGNAITVGGKVQGMLYSKDKLTLEHKADFTGDLSARILIIESGARFEGRSTMPRTPAAEPAARRAPEKVETPPQQQKTA